MALALEGTTEAPHFDRAAFKVARIYVTLAPGGKTANFNFTPDEQEFKCLLAPKAFTAIPNAWGRQGWTMAKLSELSAADLKSALEMAYAQGVAKEEAAPAVTIGWPGLRPIPSDPGSGCRHRNAGDFQIDRH